MSAAAFVVLVLVAMYAAVALALRGVQRALEERAAEAEAERARVAARDAFWERHRSLGAFPIGEADFREAGWSAARARAFLAERFPGRGTIRLDELRPFLDDPTVADVVRYRADRFAAAVRYEAIRQTWINVDDLVKSGLLPPEIRPFVCERERQSGKLVRATDLLPFVGRPIVRDLLEKKLADCRAVPAA